MYFFQTKLADVGLDGNGNVKCRSSNDDNGDSNCLENTYEIR